MAERNKKTLFLIRVVFFSMSLWLSLSLRGQNQRDLLSKWRPTHELAGVRYVGSGACAQCHAPLAAKRLANPMSRALAAVDSCEILKTHPHLSFRKGPYDYQIVREGDRSIYTVTDGPNS